MTHKPTESEERRREEGFFEECLREQGQLAAEECAELPPGATHQITTNEKGECEVTRKRFSAF
jgi:hypothetical protein